jgi:hypothetical protein
MAKTGIEVIHRKVEGVHVADAKLDILDVVLGRVMPSVCELLIAAIDPHDLSDRLREPNRDHSFSAADIENQKLVA